MWSLHLFFWQTSLCFNIRRLHAQRQKKEWNLAAFILFGSIFKSIMKGERVTEASWKVNKIEALWIQWESREIHIHRESKERSSSDGSRRERKNLCKNS